MTDLHRTIRRRSAFAQVTRGLSLLLLLGGLYNLIYATVIAMASGGGVQGFLVYYDKGFSRLGMGLGLLVPGLVLALLNRHIVRWLVPAHRYECPKCSYELHERRTGRCPECGYELAAESAPSNL